MKRVREGTIPSPKQDPGQWKKVDLYEFATSCEHIPQAAADESWMEAMRFYQGGGKIRNKSDRKPSLNLKVEVFIS